MEIFVREELFQICVAIEARAIVGDKFLALFDGDLSLLHGFAHPCFETTYETLRVILYVFQHIGYGLTVDSFINAISIFVYCDVYGVGIAKKIVHIAQNLLISTYKEYTYIIVLALAETMKRKIRRLLIVVDIGRDFAIGVAGDVLQGGRHGWVFRSIAQWA